MIMRFIELFCFSFKSLVFSDCFHVTGFSCHKPSRPSSGGVTLSTAAEAGRNHVDATRTRPQGAVVSTGRTTQAQGYRPGLVGPVLVGFQASLALLSSQALLYSLGMLRYLFLSILNTYFGCKCNCTGLARATRAVMPGSPPSACT